jgi:hypothetical protein
VVTVIRIICGRLSHAGFFALKWIARPSRNSQASYIHLERRGRYPV